MLLPYSRFHLVLPYAAAPQVYWVRLLLKLPGLPNQADPSLRKNGLDPQSSLPLPDRGKCLSLSQSTSAAGRRVCRRKGNLGLADSLC